MENNEIYEKHTTDTLNKIKHLRNAKAPRSLENDVDKLEHLKFFNIGGEDYDNYSFMVDESEKYSYKMLQNIILELLISYNISAQIVRISANVPENVFMIIGEYSGKKVLYVFKKSGLVNTILQNMVAQVMAQFDITNHKFISLVEDYAYAVQFNHNDDVFDPSRGTNIYSLKWFFETYFGSGEYKVLKRYVDKFTDDIRNYFGILVVRTLTLNALFSFKKTVTYVVNQFPIEQYVSQKFIKYGISDEQKQIIDQQYFKEGFSKAITSKCDFAESLMTAEWLYDSLKESGNIDLTAVAMGYFKAIEQLLYRYILLHKKEDRMIHKNGSKDDFVNLNDENIEGKKVDTTLGALIRFLNHTKNKDLIKEEIDEHTRKFISDKLYAVKTLRNGYFHKDNLNEWSVVEEFREKALTIFYLILGAYRFSDSDKQQLQIPSMKDQDDYFELCEFTNLNVFNPYYIDMDDGKLELYFSSHDDSIVYDEYGSAKYSGVYFRKPVGVDSNTTTILPVTDIRNKKIQPGDTVKYDIQDFQNAKIYIGRMTPVKEGMEFSGPERLIFENGRFIEIIEDKKPGY